MRLIDKLIKPPKEKYNLIQLPLLQKFLKKKTKNVFTFTVDTGFYRALAFNKDYERVLPYIEKTYPEEISFDEALQDFSKEFVKIKEIGINLKNFKFGTYIPSRYGLLKIYNFPRTLNKIELLKSVELYIQQEISESFAEKEVVYSYDILPTKSNEPYRVLTVIVEKEIVDKLYNWSIEQGIELNLISYEPVGLINLGLYKNLPEPFAILYTDVNKILMLSYQKDRILYEEFSINLTPGNIAEDILNLVIWDIRNYIVLNDIGNIYLAGIILENEEITQYFLEKLPIFGIVSIDIFPEHFALLYILGERLLHGKVF
jgi:type IV pilus assembly protein PilM